MTAPKIYIKALAAPGREAEREAVGRLIAEAFGDEAKLYHRPNGSPAVDIAGVEISISHCRTCAVLAVADRPVGVDVETDRAQLLRVAGRVMSAEEVGYYSGSLVKAWTLKEALYKAALTPGLDFRRDIRLPLTPDADAIVMTPAERRFAIVSSGWLSDYNAYLSVVAAR